MSLNNHRIFCYNCSENNIYIAVGHIINYTREKHCGTVFQFNNRMLEEAIFEIFFFNGLS